MNDRINAIENKIFQSRIWYYFTNVVIVGAFLYCIKALTDYDNMEYQVWKNQAGAKAVFAFTAVVFIVRKVRLINWQSLVATLLFSLVVIERFTFWKESPDILAILKPQLAAEWLSIMIVIDMILYKNINNLFGKLNYALILYVLLTVGMLYRRNGKMEPMMLVFPFFLFVLVKLSDAEYERLINRFTDGWFGAFVYVTIRSLIENPYSGKRYYGYFLNIGAFGTFLSCCFVVALFALIYSKEKYGRKSLFYVISVIWLLSNSVMLWITDTRTILVGVGLALLFMFFVGDKSLDSAKRKRRFIIFLVFVAIVIGLAILSVYLCKQHKYKYWRKKYLKTTGFLSPIMLYMFRLAKILNGKANNCFSNMFLNIVDALSSGRLEIAKNYSQYFNFEGNGPIGFELPSGYWVYNAHNNFVQILVEYGYITFAELLSLIVVSLTKMIRKFMQSGKKALLILPVLWIIMMLGVWIGEVSSLYYPVTFFGMMFICRSLIPDSEEKEAIEN